MRMSTAVARLTVTEDLWDDRVGVTLIIIDGGLHQRVCALRKESVTDRVGPSGPRRYHKGSRSDSEQRFLIPPVRTYIEPALELVV
jgi:hypothetical protein